MSNGDSPFFVDRYTQTISQLLKTLFQWQLSIWGGTTMNLLDLWREIPGSSAAGPQTDTTRHPWRVFRLRECSRWGRRPTCRTPGASCACAPPGFPSFDSSSASSSLTGPPRSWCSRTPAREHRTLDVTRSFWGEQPGVALLSWNTRTWQPTGVGTREGRQEKTSHPTFKSILRLCLSLVFSNTDSLRAFLCVGAIFLTACLHNCFCAALVTSDFFADVTWRVI